MFYHAGAAQACRVLGLPTPPNMAPKLAAAASPGLQHYRRVVRQLEQAAKSTHNAATPATRGYALHGTYDLPGILEEGRIIASPRGVKAQHGGGVYWWKGHPRQDYLRGAESEGILSDLASLPNQKPPGRNVYTGQYAPNELVTGPGDYRLRKGDTAVIDMPRVDSDYLAELADDLGMQTVDSAIFNTALKDHKATNMLADGRIPPHMPSTDAQINQLYEKRMSNVGTQGTRDIGHTGISHNSDIAREMDGGKLF